MDIEKLKKMNILTKDLQKGFSLPSDEAFKQAEEIFLQDRKEAIAPVKLAETSSSSMDDARLSLLLEMHEKKFLREIQELRAITDGLSGEIIMLKKEVVRLSSVPQPVSPVSAVPPVEVSKVESSKVEEKADHPRQGKYKPEDVAIDKMFYFGNK
ncbi:hypothetical protein HY486_03875 [Candidatus Woesearchaeota archaeon]|nr:hypothetical protein [Candidatus Woesearchaeota archaeon]